MKYSLKSIILGGFIAASLTGILCSCETVDPATLKSDSENSPVKLIETNKGRPGQIVVINDPNFDFGELTQEGSETDDKNQNPTQIKDSQSSQEDLKSGDATESGTDVAAEKGTADTKTSDEDDSTGTGSGTTADEDTEKEADRGTPDTGRRCKGNEV